jgi:hypothetical protein
LGAGLGNMADGVRADIPIGIRVFRPADADGIENDE